MNRQMATIAFVLFAAACSKAGQGGSSSGGTACVPGTQTECACLGGNRGVQVCRSDGTAYDPCAGCATSSGIPPSSSAASSGHASTSGAPSSSASSGLVDTAITLTITPPFYDFGEVAAGQTVGLDVTIANPANRPAQVSATCLDINQNGSCLAPPSCTSDCQPDSLDVSCSGDDPDVPRGLNCRVLNAAPSFVLLAADGLPGGPDEVVVRVSWSPPATSSFVQDLVLHVVNGPVLSMRLSFGSTGHLMVVPQNLEVLVAGSGVGAHGEATFAILNSGPSDLRVTGLSFRGMPQAVDDFKLLQPSDPEFGMGCSLAQGELTCLVQPWTSPITLSAGTDIAFRVEYMNNDAVSEDDDIHIAVDHNGGGTCPTLLPLRACWGFAFDDAGFAVLADGGAIRPACLACGGLVAMPPAIPPGTLQAIRDGAYYVVDSGLRGYKGTDRMDVVAGDVSLYIGRDVSGDQVSQLIADGTYPICVPLHENADGTSYAFVNGGASTFATDATHTGTAVILAKEGDILIGRFDFVAVQNGGDGTTVFRDGSFRLGPR